MALAIQPSPSRIGTRCSCNLQISPASGNGTGDVQVSATVTNTGTRAGSDVAQFYLGDPSGAGESPRQLAGFQRVSLGAGQSA